MKLIYKITSIFLCVFALQSCVEEITLPSNYEPAIFIFGNLSNKEEYVKITVMETTPVTDSSKKNIIDAEISLFTESNDIKSLVTKDFKITSDKLYKSSEKITPIIGNYYWIEVKLQDGTTFKSSKEKLLKPVEISKITHKDGYLKVYFEDPKDIANYYNLELSSTRDNNFYIDVSTTESDVLYDGNKNAYIESYLFFSGISPAESNIVVKLSNINFKTYQFFLNLSKKEEDSDFEGEEEGNPSQLFASPPVNLIGNIINSTTSKKALGNFGVLSKSVIPIKKVNMQVLKPYEDK